MESVSPYAVSATNRSGLIVIVETLFMTWMIMVSLIRLYMRLAINGPVKIDDVVVFAGSVMAIAHVGTIMDAISHGLGRSEDESSRSNLTRAGKVAFPSPEPPNSSFNAARKQIREVKYKDTDGCHSECLRSEPSISGWTRRSQDFHIFTSQTTRPQYRSCVENGHCLRRYYGNPYLRAVYFTSMGSSDAVEAKMGSSFRIWDEGSYYGIYSAMPKTVCYFTNGKGQNSYSTNSASTNQSHVYSTNRGGRDEADLTTSRQSQDSQHSRRLIIHQTREWWVEEEDYSMFRRELKLDCIR
ncbi:Pc12g05570 [Penicillium rubens Wisconsin 54-1255]|uniref:Pc12g05570 protein n=1 Tax=Penicillium rubens (strain ATCC 28089 / DSM 1075 / NRRL 1951 / Wisconsin 54-1255) TaxID=500485 RepID=B6GZF6_PENRW|nr:Pc12g05570 [Penicillium rubens Wisconsin 54-1255]